MKRAAVAGLTLVLAACSNSPAGQAQSAAESTTKAVYADNASGVTQNFDSELQNEFTRKELGIASDQMHRLGAYKGLTYISNDPAKNEYTYRANFASGSMNVVERLDANGKLSAYRVFPIK